MAQQILSIVFFADYFTNNFSFTHKFNENTEWTNSLFYSHIDYFFDSNQINIDDMVRLEQIAGLENECMRHQIFFVFKLDEAVKIFTSLN